MILTSKNIQLTSESKIYFENSSVNLSSSLNLYIISDVQINNLLCKITTGTQFQLFKIQSGTVIPVDSIDNSNVESSQVSGKWIYKINLLFSSEFSGDYKDVIDIRYGSTNVSLEMLASSEEINEQLLISLQNFKKYISEDYVSAFRESVNYSKEIDTELYNRKMREMLHNIFELTALHSSYKNLLTILSYFGYGDLLTIKEYWTSNQQYKSTDISNAVLTVIEKQLIGYSKSNQMSLVYQINEQTGIDDDGLPIYSNVFDNTDEILTKLYALERVLTKDFLYINTHIVDIVGEFQTVVGIELNVVLNDVMIEDVKLTDNLNSEVRYEFVNKTVYIERHNVIIEPFVFQSNTSNQIEFIPGIITGTQYDNIFHVEHILGDTFKEFELLTKFYSGDFGMLELKLDLDLTRYQSFRYTIQEVSSGAFVFTSKLYNIESLSDDQILRCGLKNVGNYKLVLYLIDWYGALTVVGIQDPLIVTTRPIDIFIGKYDALGEIDKDLDLYTTFKDTTGISGNIVVDNLSETLDINTWDPITNTPTMLIARMYESDFDQIATYTNLNQLNSIPLTKLNGLPLHTWGHSYGIGIFDIIGDRYSSVVGIQMRNFSHLDYEDFYKYYDGSDEAEFLTQYIADLNEYNLVNPESIFNDFTWDVHWYSNDPISLISDARPMVRAKSKMSGLSMSIVDIQVNNVQSHNDFPDKYVTNNVKIFSRVDANLQFSVVNPASGIMTIIVGDTFTTSINVNVTDVQSLVTAIESVFPENVGLHIHVSVVNESIMIYSKHDFKITHDSIGGTHFDNARGLDSSKIKKLDLGADIKLGEPFFAFIDVEKRIDLGDVTWILKNTLTNEIVTTQHAWSFRWIVSAIGSYSLTMNCTDKSGFKTMTKHGCIVTT